MQDACLSSKQKESVHENNLVSSIIQGNRDVEVFS